MKVRFALSLSILHSAEAVICTRVVILFVLLSDGNRKRHISPIHWDDKGEEKKENDKKEEKSAEGEKKGQLLAETLLSRHCLGHCVNQCRAFLVVVLQIS